MRILAVIPSDRIEDYLKGGYSKEWLKAYYNPCGFFDKVYLLSPDEKDNSDLLGMEVIRTSARELKKRVKDLDVNIVRAYGGNWACRMACENKVKDVPVVVSVHDISPDMLYGSIKKADIVFCVSKAVEKLVKTEYRDPSKIWMLPNRVDFQRMRPFPKKELAHLDKKYLFQHKILYVGRLVKEKNLDTLIKALGILGKDYCVIAVGRGDKKYYQHLAQEENVQKRCFFVDSIAHDDLAQYFSWCDCMCTPSRSEGFGMVFVEALACESVVITADIAPMNEFIKHRDNGLLVKECENPGALAEMIKIACTDNILRKQLKNKSRSSVKSFERSKIDQLEVRYYQKILEKKKIVY